MDAKQPDPRSPGRSLSWGHIGDLDPRDVDGWQRCDLLAEIGQLIEVRLGDRVDLVFLPGDDADRGTVDRYGAMTRGLDGMWCSEIPLNAGLHAVTVSCAGRHNVVEPLVRDVDACPERRLPIAPWHDCYAVGAWPIAGTDGAQLGPDKSGRGW